MPATKSAVSTLIQEVLADPGLAHDDVFRRLLGAGLQDLIDAEAEAVIGDSRYERTPERVTRLIGAVLVDQHEEWQYGGAATCPRPP